MQNFTLHHDLLRFLTDKEVANLTGVSVQTLRNHRHQGRGFPYRKFGRSVRYKLTEVLEYLERHKIEPEQQNGEVQ